MISILKKIIVLISFMAFLGIGALGCEQEGPAEKAGEKIDESVEQAGEKMEEAQEEAGEKMEEAEEETEELMEEGEEKME
ncbi:MAG: hypothetical protein R6U27_11505 [Desulfobacterales bacterium]